LIEVGEVHARLLLTITMELENRRFSDKSQEKHPAKAASAQRASFPALNFHNSKLIEGSLSPGGRACSGKAEIRFGGKCPTLGKRGFNRKTGAHFCGIRVTPGRDDPVLSASNI
jgi:hypothetical protein